MTVISTDTLPAAEYLVRHMYRPIELRANKTSENLLLAGNRVEFTDFQRRYRSSDHAPSLQR